MIKALAIAFSGRVYDAYTELKDEVQDNRERNYRFTIGFPRVTIEHLPSGVKRRVKLF